MCLVGEDAYNPSKLLHLFVPQLSHLKDEGNNCINAYLIE